MAQILWARKTHTDDLDVAVASGDLAAAFEAVREQTIMDWTEPAPPDIALEGNDVFDGMPSSVQGKRGRPHQRLEHVLAQAEAMELVNVRLISGETGNCQPPAGKTIPKDLAALA